MLARATRKCNRTVGERKPGGIWLGCDPYYYRARYYDPTTGRFAGEDPIGFNGGINMYRYVGNAPVGFDDPTGLCPGGKSSGPDPWRERLKKCVADIYHVTAGIFNPARRGENGNFYGTYNGKQFHVETDVGSFSTFVLTIKGLSLTPLAGLTLGSSPYLNYLANDLTPEEMYPVDWVHELGHALDLITSGKSSEPSAEKFEECVKINP